MPQDESWDADQSREIARSAPGRPPAGFYGAVPDGDKNGSRSPEDPADDEPEWDEEIEVVPVRRKLSVAIAGFAALLAAGLIFGAETAGLDSRVPYAIVLFGV